MLVKVGYLERDVWLDFIQFSDAARSVEFGFISTTSELSNVSLKGRRHEIHWRYIDVTSPNWEAKCQNG